MRLTRFSLETREEWDLLVARTYMVADKEARPYHIVQSKKKRGKLFFLQNNTQHAAMMLGPWQTSGGKS